jgi:hypothetical protein
MVLILNFDLFQISDYRENFRAYMGILRNERVNHCNSKADDGNYYLQTWAVEGGYANLMPGSRLLQYG